MPCTNRDITTKLWGAVVTIPKGTRVHLIKGASGTAGDLWAVSSVADLIKLTGNSHDPKYRYAWVNAGDVDTSN